MFKRSKPVKEDLRMVKHAVARSNYSSSAAKEHTEGDFEAVVLSYSF